MPSLHYVQISERGDRRLRLLQEELKPETGRKPLTFFVIIIFNIADRSAENIGNDPRLSGEIGIENNSAPAHAGVGMV